MVNIQHPHPALPPQQNTNKVKECHKFIQTKYILKIGLKGGREKKKDFVLCFLHKQIGGTPQMLSFSKIVKKRVEMSKTYSFIKLR